MVHIAQTELGCNSNGIPLLEDVLGGFATSSRTLRVFLQLLQAITINAYKRLGWFLLNQAFVWV